jgi:hypothetical protein
MISLIKYGRPRDIETNVGYTAPLFTAALFMLK